METRAGNALHALEIHINLPHALEVPIQNVQIALSHPMPRLVVVVGVAGLVTMDTINIIRLAISVAQRVRDIHTNQNLAALPKTANARAARNHTKHRGTTSMAVVGHAIQVIINLAVLALHVHRHVQLIRWKRLPVEQHKTAYVHHAQNLPIQHLPTLQDAAGVVILAITKVAIIALLALHVQQDSMNQEVVHPHKIVNVVQNARLSATVNLVGNMIVMVVKCCDAKRAITRMETRARNVHQRAKIMAQQEK